MDRDNPNRDESPIMGDSNEASYGETKSSPEKATHFRESYFIEEDEEEALEQSFSRRKVVTRGGADTLRAVYSREHRCRQVFV